MKTNEKITIIVKGIQVEGIITYRSGSDIGVEIISPYKDSSSGSHIPYFARAFNSMIGEYGDKRAKDILEELYYEGKYGKYGNWETRYTKINLLQKLLRKRSYCEISRASISDQNGH